MSNLFSDGSVVLNYSHHERLIIGGACPRGGPLKLPAQAASVAGAPLLERREMGIINVGSGAGAVTADGARFELSLARWPLSAHGHPGGCFRGARRQRQILSDLHDGSCAI